jgi:hypothetical protein
MNGSIEGTNSQIKRTVKDRAEMCVSVCVSVSVCV